MSSKLKIQLLFVWVFIASYLGFAHIEPNLNFNVPRLALEATFLEGRWGYFSLMLASVFFPVVLSFDKKVAFYKNYQAILLAALACLLFFVPLDVFYTHYGVWGFNPRYYMLSFCGLPESEWLFFVVVPYCCLFIHACLNAYFPIVQPAKLIRPLLIVLFSLFGLLSVFSYNLAYTSSKSALAAMFCLHALYYNSPKENHQFIRSYLVSILPFLLINSVLTGSFTQSPIVVYTESENLVPYLGRVFSIPPDDFIYNFLLVYLSIYVFEQARKRAI